MATHRFPSLPAFPVSDELRIALKTLLGSASLSTPEPLWLEAIEGIAGSLHANPRVIAPFVEAWRLLYVVTLFLDHLQDGDPLGEPQLEALPPAIQYHLAFSVYLAAQHTLALLDSSVLPAARIERIQRFWAASVARLASGQYVDLSLSVRPAKLHGEPALNMYEWLALEKTGATFALAFGGVAMLATDDEVQIAALTEAGSVYGMLLQYRDDLVDREQQEGQPEALTLTRALLAAHPSLAAHSVQATSMFWNSIYAEYRQTLAIILAPLPATTRTIYEELLRQSFGEPSEADRPTGGVPSREATG